MFYEALRLAEERRGADPTVHRRSTISVIRNTTETSRVRLAENNAVQADAMGRKALALATGDPDAEASAWRLIADAMRASGRNADASEADRQAAAAVAR